MSQSITIKEGDIAQGFGHINKLRTSNGSDHDTWVPEDEVDTESLYASKNGLYYTKAYEPTKSEKKKGKKGKCYGYDSVTVSIINQTYGFNDDDVPISVGVDEEGNLTETELPVRIEIVKDPNVVVWLDGADISINGIQVKAYMADDSEYETGTEGNIIPIEQLSIEPEQADYSKQEGGGWVPSSGSGIPSDIIPLKKCQSATWRSNDSFIYKGELFGSSACTIIDKANSSQRTRGVDTIVASTDNPDIYALRTNMKTGETYRSGARTVTLHDKTFYMANGSFWYDNKYKDSPDNTIPNVSESDYMPYKEIAYTMLFGTYVLTGQEITVSWTPPEGVEELTDTYTIRVVPSPVTSNETEGEEDDI